MSLVNLHTGSLVVMSASDWARTTQLAPTDVVAMPGSRLLIFPDAWTPAEVIAEIQASGASHSGTSVPPGVPPSG